MTKTIWEMQGMSKAARDDYMSAGGKVTYPLSFWALVVIGSLSMWFIYAITSQPPSQAALDQMAREDAADNATLACVGRLRDGAQNPTTFDYERTGAKATDSGHLVEVWFSVANMLGARGNYAGICSVDNGSVTAVKVNKR